MNYKQQSNQGCLIVSLLYLFAIEPTREQEQQVLSEGLFRVRENYTIGCTLAFLDHYKDTSVTIYVDNKYYCDELATFVNHPRLDMVHKKIDQNLLESLSAPFVVYVDNNITNGWMHLPHFVLVTKATDKFYEVFDPWEGKRRNMSKAKLMSGVSQLRDHVKICPFVITSN